MKYEARSTQWRQHCAEVAHIEDLRRKAERRNKVKIGAHYVPPPAPIMGCFEPPTEPQAAPTWWVQTLLGFLIVVGFFAMAYAL